MKFLMSMIIQSICLVLVFGASDAKVKTVGARAAITQADKLIAKAKLSYPAAVYHSKKKKKDIPLGAGDAAVTHILRRWAAVETTWITIPNSQEKSEYNTVLQMIEDAGHFSEPMAVSLNVQKVSKVEDPSDFDPMDIRLGILIEGTYKPSKATPTVSFVVSCDAEWADRIDYQKVVQAKKIKVTLTVEQFVILYTPIGRCNECGSVLRPGRSRKVVKLSHIGAISGNLLDIDKQFQK